MSNNCLVTKYKGTVNDNLLPRVGEAYFDVNSQTSFQLRNFGISSARTSNGTSWTVSGMYIDIPAGNYRLFLYSKYIGAFYVLATSSSDIKGKISGDWIEAFKCSNFLNGDPSFIQLAYCSLNANLDNFPSVSAGTNTLVFNGAPNVVGRLSSFNTLFPGLTNIQMNGSRISGNIEDFGSHPNISNITTFNLSEYINCRNIEGFVSAARTSGVTSRSLFPLLFARGTFNLRNMNYDCSSDLINYVSWTSNTITIQIGASGSAVTHTLNPDGTITDGTA